MLNNKYLYDKVSNIVQVKNSAPFTTNKMAGIYTHNFRYDNLNRLSGADGSFNGDASQILTGNDANSTYNLRMSYNDTHGIVSKNQYHNKNGTTYQPNTYDNDYTYAENTHQVQKIEHYDNDEIENFRYDLNGNIIQRSNRFGSRTFLWDESNRLRVVSENNAMQHYIYDASGERILKANSDVEAVYENGILISPGTVTINGYTSYPSGFLVISPDGLYTKHYYANSQRLVSRIGDNDASIFESNFIGFKQESDDSKFDEKELKNSQKIDLQNYASKLKRGIVAFRDYQFLSLAQQEEAILADREEESDSIVAKIPINSPPIYYYHSDHLGTSTSLTDYNGKAYQFFLNLPFGETMAQQRGSNYFNSPYKFNGKELDEETGFYYDGARYYDPKISIWMSVDPLAEKYPNISPYVYCASNPVLYIDPDGREIILASNMTTNQKLQVLGTMQKLTNDKLVYKTLKNGTTIIKVASLGKGNKSVGTNLIRSLNSSDQKLTIQTGTEWQEQDLNGTNAINGKGSDTLVDFALDHLPNLPTVDSNTGEVSGKKSNAVTNFGHELIHAERSMRGEAINYDEKGTHTYSDGKGGIISNTKPKEELATTGVKYNKRGDPTENQLRKEQGQEKRATY